MIIKDFTACSDKKLKNFMREWEDSLPSRRLIGINTYINARKEAFKRWNDNSNYYISFFTQTPSATIDKFNRWFREI